MTTVHPVSMGITFRMEHDTCDIKHEDHVQGLAIWIVRLVPGSIHSAIIIDCKWKTGVPLHVQLDTQRMRANVWLIRKKSWNIALIRLVRFFTIWWLRFLG